jgi:2-dehydro-3-deoxyphosphogluconate aldolase/(4S)-4-hydroxy-2-oxoglutarate aldolase
MRDAGIATAEVTLRTPAALDAIAAMAAVEGFTVGAGTVLTPENVEAAVKAGAEYLVSPGLDDAALHRAAEVGVPLIPGIATATDAQRVFTAGLRHVKLFPASSLGGRSLIDALAGPFPDLQFLPSGGVTIHNMTDYLRSPSVFAVSGSWMVPRACLATGDMATVDRVARTASAAGLAA